MEDFYEIKRYQLDPGKYELKITIKDLNSEEKKEVSGVKNFVIKEVKNEIVVSDILPAEYVIKSDEESVFQRSGLHIIPMFSNFFSSISGAWGVAPIRPPVVSPGAGGIG